MRRAARRLGDRQGEAGAALVEYTLMLGVFVLVSVGAAAEMNDNAEQYFADSSDHIGSPVNRFEYGEDGNRPGANTLASTTTITAPPTTSTTSPPTTAPPATTTSAAPTTTTAPTTTLASTTTVVSTTTQPDSVSTTIEDVSIPKPGSNKWHAKARVTVSGSGGVDVSGVPITGSFTRSNGTTVTRSCTTNNAGTCTMSKNNSGKNLKWWDFKITSVGAAVPWTGTENELRIRKP